MTEETPEVEAEESVEEEAVETEEEVVEETEEEVEEDIPVRSNASHIIERKNQQIAKLKAQLEEPVEEEPEDDESRLDRVEKALSAQADEAELKSFFDTEPDARTHEKEIRKFMERDEYKEVAPEVIYAYIEKKASVTDGKRKAADLEAGQSKSAGSGTRDTRSKDDKTASEIKEMTGKEFMEYEKELHRKSRT